MTTQHQIDLLPESMRARTQARAQVSRNIGIAMVGLIAVAACITHARLLRDAAEGRLETLSAEAAVVAEVDRQRDGMQEALEKYDALAARYRLIESPIPLSRLLATIAEVMPQSVSLDEIILDADQTKRLRPTRGAAARREPDQKPPRILVGELSGFAESDLDIAEFVANLANRPPLSNVSWDFSKQTEVRGHSARQFRLSFVVDMEVEYEVHDSPTSPNDSTTAPSQGDGAMTGVIDHGE